jgi:prepilin-type processing-associated H-X9-DG protein
MYETANKGRFPALAGGSYAGHIGPPAHPEDWVYWWPQAKLQDSAIAKYMGRVNPNLFICPSDILDAHVKTFDNVGYPFSYVMNRNFGCDINPLLRVTSVRNSSEKIILAEEAISTVNDGHWYPGWVSGGIWQITPAVDLLSIRHEPTRSTRPDTASPPISNPERRGNVAFIDGHADFVQRKYAHTREHAWPN